MAYAFEYILDLITNQKNEMKKPQYETLFYKMLFWRMNGSNEKDWCIQVSGRVGSYILTGSKGTGQQTLSGLLVEAQTRINILDDRKNILDDWQFY